MFESSALAKISGGLAIFANASLSHIKDQQ